MKTGGPEFEEKAIRALALLSKEWREIITYHHSKKDGEVDILHTDILIFLKSNFAFPLQIKSTRGAARKHDKKYPHIISIFVRGRDSEKKIANIIKHRILRQYKKSKILLFRFKKTPQACGVFNLTDVETTALTS